MCLETGKGGDINSDRRKNPRGTKIQLDSGEAMEKCEKSCCLPATAQSSGLKPNTGLTRACSVVAGPW